MGFVGSELSGRQMSRGAVQWAAGYTCLNVGVSLLEEFVFLNGLNGFIVLLNASVASETPTENAEWDSAQGLIS